MNIDDVLECLNESIDSVDLILLHEDMPVYHQIHGLLMDANDCLIQKNFSHAMKYLLTCIRLLLEAPTKKKDLGFNALKKIDKTYKLIKVIKNV